MRSVKVLSWPVLCFCIFSLLFLSLSRIALALWQLPRVNAVGGWGFVLLQGVRFDVATLCLLWGVPLLISLLLGNRWLRPLWGLVLRVWLTLGLWLLVLLEISTPSFMLEYGVRPDRLYVEYLMYPKEVVSMLWGGGRPLETIFVLTTSVVVLVAGWVVSGLLMRASLLMRWYKGPLWAVLAFPLVFMGARSTLGHRPLNVAMAAFSTDPLVNTLAPNSFYTLMSAVFQMSDEISARKLYGKMPPEQIVSRVRALSGRPLSWFARDNNKAPSVTYNRASYQGRPKNLVIILEESLGARFIGTLGGLPLSPHFDRLAQQGWLFDRLYATGTRSVRGIEAVVAGFTPTPSRSVVKLGKSQTGFFTLADVLKKRGYRTQFIYGGESHFDNMRSFFLGNGFQNIVDQDDYKNPVFRGSWGVSDEDLFRRANGEFEQFYRQGHPFFSLVFSTSNHDPFQYPDGRIKLYKPPKQTRDNAAKYADYALGGFFQQARKEAYYKDTIFLIVADHDSRARGNTLVPISRFHIPALILGEGIEPKRDERVLSQIDMPTTLLSLIGISGKYPMLGRDLTQTPDHWPGRAMMQFHNNFALMRGDNVVILEPKKEPKGFVYNKQANTLLPAHQPMSMKKDALAWVLWGEMAYQKRLYHLE